jgi:gluconolactonase
MKTLLNGEMRVVADDLEFPEGPIAEAGGTVLVVEIRGQRLTRVYADGRKEIVAHLSGGPNRAAVGPDGALLRM